MATKYEILFQVCSDSVGTDPLFNIGIPFYVYSNNEWTNLCGEFRSLFGTGNVQLWRNKPLTMTEAGSWFYEHFPHMTDGVNIANLRGHTEWYDVIQNSLNIGSPLTSAFSQLPVTTTSSLYFETREFYLKRIKDSYISPQVFTYGKYGDSATAANQTRPDNFTSGASSGVLNSYLTYGRGGGSSITGYTLNQNGLYIVSDDFSGTIDENITLKYGSVQGYLGETPYCSVRDLENGYTVSSGTLDIMSNIEIKPSGVTPDPYEQGGTSGTGGGTGTFDLTSDPVDFPALPTLTAVDTGLVSVYTPTLAQMKALATYMWNANPTDIDWWKKLVANPLDLILGLSIVPVQVPAGAAQNVKIGLIDTGVAITKAASQFVEVDCGSIEVKEFYGAALDYLPFRKTSIYLPFIGTRTISTDDIMGKTVHVKYHVDLLSGACTAMVKCGDAVLYQYSGACAVSIPLSGETFTSMITSTIQLAASVAGTIASGGAAAGITAAAAANSVMSMKPQIERAGGVSGAAGQLGIMKPYLIGEIPRQSVPENYNTFAGYPSNIKATLADLSGFTSIETVHLQGIPATSEEYDEIERLLKEGVIL